jgi:hypothetical protein
MKYDESQRQQALIKWWGFAHKKHGVAEAQLLAIPNGGARNIITGARLKKEGVRRGIPDLFLAVPAGGHHGLFIEMKTPSGKLSAEQDNRMAELFSAGYECVVCCSFDAAKWEIETYLKSGDAL